MRNIKPTTGFLLVKRLPPEEKTKGGLFIPEAQRKPHKEGTVMNVSDESIYKPGMKIVYASVTIPVLIKGDEHHIVSEKDVVGTIIEEE